MDLCLVAKLVTIKLRKRLMSKGIWLWNTLQAPILFANFAIPCIKIESIWTAINVGAIHYYNPWILCEVEEIHNNINLFNKTSKLRKRLMLKGIWLWNTLQAPILFANFAIPCIKIESIWTGINIGAIYYYNYRILCESWENKYLVRIPITIDKKTRRTTHFRSTKNSLNHENFLGLHRGLTSFFQNTRKLGAYSTLHLPLLFS